MHNFLLILQIIVSILLIAVVLVQPGKTNGLSGFISGGTTESFYSRNKSRTSEAMLSRLTVFLAIIFAVLCVVQNLIK
ncbi:MAG: preprotein translocase subunit SecG [Clostridium sp.]|uniref:preprotein translocase subunit SecG n=1 Tax=Clostridium sp. TaxID=1506 RepID=UPI0025BE4499|nr:preprotein translocase subunit SecG [Clostridium sp.]MCH3965150.1 preprotein translocase subunit SecG [Clostridium sp.]MCI1714371.1 preprotein translocase subunit SecG [Clostridium sp.]MCI1798633.1 preprotein translocase subunit SecG [Clostridium sp.]MCI1812636.1 preprotein translocase subunit SecG [Clostridium sp.]MCI1869442.1 preprotein translocase subunit SecG [Clostridium sp.]